LQRAAPDGPASNVLGDNETVADDTYETVSNGTDAEDENPRTGRNQNLYGIANPRSYSETMPTNVITH
jgi:hypothetical protein